MEHQIFGSWYQILIQVEVTMSEPEGNRGCHHFPHQRDWNHAVLEKGYLNSDFYKHRR